MMNDFSNTPAESEFRNEMTQSSEEPMNSYLFGCEPDNDPTEIANALGELARKIDSDDSSSIDHDTPLGQLYGDGEDNDQYTDTDPILPGEEQEEYNGWPGDGSGTDDLADYNANEAADYQNE